MKLNEYTDSEFNMRRTFYEKTVREDDKKTQPRPAGNRTRQKRTGRLGPSKAQA